MPTEEQARIAEEAAKALGITQLMPTIYKDLLQPAAKETGQHLVVVAQAVGIALAPFETAVWGYQRIKDYLSAKVAAKLADTPPAEIISPDPVIAGPVMMSMVFAVEAPHLREMYANLVARAMHSPSASKAHPSFVQVIQQLSSAEARILQEIAKKFVPAETIFKELLDEGGLWEKGSKYISSQWQDFCLNFGVTEKSLADAYYYNLIRLGILIERKETEATLCDRDDMRSVVATTTTNSVMLTDYGDLFLDVCVRDI
jgi:hypothetical protein